MIVVKVETLVLRSALDVKGGTSSLSEVIAIRKALDLGIGAELVAAMKGTKNPELEKLVTSMRKHAEAGETYYDDDIAFHSTLIKQLHNTMLEQLISAMWLIHQTVTPSLHPADHEAMLVMFIFILSKIMSILFFIKCREFSAH